MVRIVIQSYTFVVDGSTVAVFVTLLAIAAIVYINW